MTKQIIAIDVDDVLLPHFGDLIAWYNKTYGTHLSLADNGNDDPRTWGAVTAKEAIKRVHFFFESREFKNAKPFSEAKDVLTHLSARYELVVVTARDSIVEQVTRDWLEHHFADLIREAHFTAFYSLEGKTRRKSDVCNEIGAKFLIDDSLSNVLGASVEGVQSILFGNYPWNQADELPSNVVRCIDWPAVLEYFDARDSS